jgi:hypothetical protein
MKKHFDSKFKQLEDKLSLADAPFEKIQTLAKLEEFNAELSQDCIQKAMVRLFNF